MEKRTTAIISLVLGFGLILVSALVYAADPAVKCEAGKLKEAGKYGYCCLKAESKGVRKGLAPDFTKCDAKLATKWNVVEGKAQGACPTNGDQTAVQGEISDHTDRIAWLLSGATTTTTTPPTTTTSSTTTTLASTWVDWVTNGTGWWDTGDVGMGGAGSFSFGWWSRVSTTPSGDTSIVSAGVYPAGGYSGQGIHTYISSGNKRLYLRVNQWNGGWLNAADYFDATSIADDGLDHHFVVVRDGTTGYVRLYVDGGLKVTLSSTWLNGYAIVIEGGGLIHMGYRPMAWGGSIVADTRLGELFVWNDKLTTAEIDVHRGLGRGGYTGYSLGSLTHKYLLYGANFNDSIGTAHGLAAGSGGEFRQVLTARFVDLGLTVLDVQTGLEWEKKDGEDGFVDAGNPHDVDNTYAWATATGTWISDVNTENFAGHSDWRVPEAPELMTILDYTGYNPAVDPIFGPTETDWTWTATTSAGSPSSAWAVHFLLGDSGVDNKTASWHVRAVRDR